MGVETSESRAFVGLASLPIIEDKIVWEYFQTTEEALSFYDAAQTERRAVWVGEYGEYVNKNGRRTQSWITFYWNQPVAEWNEWHFPPDQRGTGYPDTAFTKLVDYVPIR